MPCREFGFLSLGRGIRGRDPSRQGRGSLVCVLKEPSLPAFYYVTLTETEWGREGEPGVGMMGKQVEAGPCGRTQRPECTHGL